MLASLRTIRSSRGVRCLFPLFLMALAASQSSRGQGPAAMKMAVMFATPAEAREVLSQRDEFVERMSPFDRAARLKTDQDVTEAQYQAFVGKNVLAWTEQDKQRVTAVLKDLLPRFQAMALPFPQKVLMIRTTGDEEGQAAYTRANAIVLPTKAFDEPESIFWHIVTHEFFHILSRSNPALRDRLYAIIGFAPCSELEFPPELKAQKITNPDAPKNDHCISLTIAGKETLAIPILLSRRVKYDPVRGGEFFDYLAFLFLAVDKVGNDGAIKPIYDDSKPRLIEVKDASGFMEKIGKNTEFIIHPEEILADNFALLMSDQAAAPSPEILKQMRKVFGRGK